MQASITMVLVGILLSCTVAYTLISSLIVLFVHGEAGGLLGYGFAYFEQLFGTPMAKVFTSFVVLVITILLFRFLISWLGEDSGSSANS